jgi:predicted enzyme related to lactoylglutathione lyase
MPRPVYFDINAENPQRALKFYQDAFGWKYQKWDGPMEYWMLMTGDDKEPGINGGLSPRDSGENSTIMNTIQVECVDTHIDKVKTSGARSPKKKTHPRRRLYGLLPRH